MCVTRSCAVYIATAESFFRGAHVCRLSTFRLLRNLGRLPHRGESLMSMNGSPLANVRPSLAVYLPDPSHGVEEAIISVPQANGQVSEWLELV